MASTEMTLRQETEAGHRLIIGIAELVGDNDTETRHDLIEGETNLFEALSRGLDELNDCQMMITGIREQETLLSERRERIIRRKEILCALIEQSMMSIEVFSVRLPAATLSMVKRPPVLEVRSEADIPARFWCYRTHLPHGLIGKLFWPLFKTRSRCLAQLWVIFPIV